MQNLPLIKYWYTVRARLLLLVLLVVIPALGVQVYGAWSDLQQSLNARKLESVRVIDHAQSDFDRLLSDTRTVFTDLVRLKEMRSSNNCTQIFTNLRFAFERLAREATNLGLADAQGNIYCAINPVQGDKSIAAQIDFQTALQTLDLSPGVYRLNPSTGLPVLSVSYPVLSFDGKVQSVIFATFGIGWLENWQSEVSLPPGAALTLLASDDTVLWRTVNGENVPVNGLTGPKAEWFSALYAGEAVVESPDFDGVVRLHTVIPLKNTATLHLGYPVTELYNQMFQALRWKLALLGLVVVLALGVAWWGSETLFLHPLNNLLSVVKRVQGGDLSARVAALGGLGELSELAQSFDQMTDALQRREAERQQSETRFRAMFESSTVGIGIMSMDRKMIEANPALCKTYGYSLEELIGQTPALVTYPDDFPRSTSDFEELVAGNRSEYFDERRYVRKNGEVFWAQITMSVVRDPDGKPLYLVGMVLDINEERLALAKLQESEARFRAMFENSALGVLVLDVQSLSVRANAAAGLILDDPYLDRVLLDVSDFIHPEFRQAERPFLTELLAGKRDSYEAEHWYCKSNGICNCAYVTYSGVRAEDGQLRYVVAMLQDITERKNAQDTLRESEARFRSMFDNAAVGVAVMTLDRHITQINQTASRIIGYPLEEITTLDPSMLAIEEDRFIDRDLFTELVEGKRDQYTIEKRYLRADGSIFWGRVNFSAVRGADGKPLYTIGMIEDITEEKRAAENLAAQDAEYRRMLEQRIAERTEELNRANELLRAKAAQDAVSAERTRLARDLHDAVTQTLFSATLIADVLPDLWQMNADEGQRRVEELRLLTRGALAEMRALLVELRPNALVEVPLPTLLRQLTEALTGRARINIQLSTKGERKLPPDVQVGLYRIAQEALNNVVKHAKATQAIVTLRLEEAVRLTVADNGTGFDPNSVTADHLGLKIMRERAEVMGAKFSVYSEPGEGTQISVVWQQS